MDKLFKTCSAIFLLWACQIFSISGESSYPYLSGYTWLHFCDWRLTNDDFGGPGECFEPEKVELGDTVFVDYTCLEEFKNQYMPKIKHKIILITSNYGYGGDMPVPGPYYNLVEEEKIAAWFVQNIDCESSEKLIPIPIGLASKHWKHGNTDLFDKWIPVAMEKEKRRLLLYLNFAVSPERVDCAEYFLKLGMRLAGSKPFEEYLSDLSDSIFVISPRGNGLDCHRTWEALVMGCYPIVISSTLDPLYEDLPVIIVKDWREITFPYLLAKYAEYKSKVWSNEKLYAEHWFQRVRQIQQQLRNH